MADVLARLLDRRVPDPVGFDRTMAVATAVARIVVTAVPVQLARVGGDGDRKPHKESV
jgi:hypothetical protein